MANFPPSREFLDTFKSVIESNPVLSAEEEKAMIKGHADNPEYVREQLILHNIKLAIEFGMDQYDRVASTEDLCQRALVGLVKAAQNYDLNSDCRFNTYAVWVMKTQFNDLSNQRSSGAVHRATISCLDRNIEGKKGESETTVANFIHQDGELVDPFYVLPDPSSEDRRRMDADDYRALVAHVAKSITSLGKATSEEERKLEYRTLNMVSMRLQGKTFEQIGETYGLTRERIRQILERNEKGIVKRLKEIGDDPELEFLVRKTSHYENESPKVTNEEIAEFIRNNKIRITSRAGKAIREDHLRKVFEDALAYSCSKAGTRTDDPVYGMMRKVYVQNVIFRRSITRTAEILGIPLAYAKFHRKRAFQIMKDYRISQKPNERAKSLYDHGLQIHFKPWYGGFYSEWSRYHSYEHEIEMTQRELSINVMLGNVYKKGCNFKVSSGRRTIAALTQ